MYYEVYNIHTNKSLTICPDFESAHSFLQMMQDHNLDIRPILKEDHPLSKKSNRRY